VLLQMDMQSHDSSLASLDTLIRLGGDWSQLGECLDAWCPHMRHCVCVCDGAKAAEAGGRG